MRDYLDLASVPVCEPCACVGSNDYLTRARIECRAFVDQLKRTYPQALAAGVTFRIKSNFHDFGTYLEVQVCFNDEDEAQAEWAYLIESDLPEYWDYQAQAMLRAAGYLAIPRETLGA